MRTKKYKTATFFFFFLPLGHFGKEFCLSMEEELMQTFSFRVKERTGKHGIVMVVCYRPSNQGEQVVEAIYRQIGTA